MTIAMIQKYYGNRNSGRDQQNNFATHSLNITIR